MVGRAPAVGSVRCPGGIIQTASYPNGLTLYLTDEEFVGWRLGDQTAGTTCPA